MERNLIEIHPTLIRTLQSRTLVCPLLCIPGVRGNHFLHLQWKKGSKRRNGGGEKRWRLGSIPREGNGNSSSSSCLPPPPKCTGGAGASALSHPGTQGAASSLLAWQTGGGAPLVWGVVGVFWHSPLPWRRGRSASPLPPNSSHPLSPGRIPCTPTLLLPPFTGSASLSPPTPLGPSRQSGKGRRKESFHPRA